MVTSDRQYEKSPFLQSNPVNNFNQEDFFYPALRQGVYQYFEHLPYRRVLLPEYVPQGIHDPFNKLSFEIRYYSMDLSLNLNRDEILDLISDFKPEIFVYIHYFGTYIKGNIEFLKIKLPQGMIFFEDCAHTVPHNPSLYSGDICGFSFPKMLGVSEGTVLRIKDKKLVQKPLYMDESPISRELHKRLRTKLAVENVCSTFIKLPLFQRLIQIMLGKSQQYYPYLMAHYTETATSVSSDMQSTINHLDFNKIYSRRKKIAQLYLEKLNRLFLFDLDHECFLTQSLYGFPIKVDDQERFHKYLEQRGVRGCLLNKRWWFKDSIRENELLNRHYLLPISHYLSNHQINRIINTVNSY